MTQFISHLRSVNFSLVLASLTLLIASHLIGDTGFERAYRQLKQINLVRNELTGTWISEQAKAHRGMHVSEIWEKNDNLCVVIEVDYSGEDAAELETLIWKIPARYTYVSVDREDQMHFRDVQLGAPYDLVRFKQAWDALYALRDGLAIKALHWDNSAVAVNENIWANALKSLSVKECEPDTEPVSGVSFSSQMVKPGKRVEYVKPAQANGYTWLLEVVPDQRDLRALFYYLNFPVTVETTFIDLQELFLREFSLDWGKGPYDIVFPELAKVARGLETLELGQLQLYFSQLKQDQGERMELFGANLPLSLVVPWGTLGLAMLQLYFLLHYRAALREGVFASQAESFPWLGAYEDRLSKTLFAVSCTGLPVLTSSVLTWRASTEYGFQGLVFPGAVAIYLLSLTAAVLTLVAVRKRPPIEV